ncbi:MAG: adenylate/guanylate cyclase domain-containing protein [Acidimicrobiia bacterium]|jgi:class 3 adenylate cyclase/pimeloyl-ACP methyl ester carboxylesterase
MRGKPETRYCDSAKGFIGYQIFGEGPPDIVFVTNWLTNVEVIWEEPSARRYLERLASIGRVVFIDKRGTGVSDPHGVGRVLPVEEYVDDIISVLDEVGISEAVLIGDTEGGTLALVLAATYPDRFPSLVLVNAFARLRRDDDYPIGAPEDVMERLHVDWQTMAGRSADPLNLMAPSVADDPRFRASWLRQVRLSMPPGVAGEAVAWIGDTDVRGVLPAIQARTLVVARSDARVHRASFGRYLAEQIEGSTYRELDGTDTLPFYAGDFGPVLDEIEVFVTGERNVVDSNRMLATVLFTDIVGSTAIASEIGDDRWLDLRSAHDEIVADNLERYRGTAVKTTGDGVLATFDGPQRAVLCALSMKEELAAIGVSIRAGLHTGEVEIRDNELGGLAVNIASRVMGAAEAGGVMVSRTVKDLVVGSKLEFVSCGVHELKGVEGDWDLYEVTGSRS